MQRTITMRYFILVLFTFCVTIFLQSSAEEINGTTSGHIANTSDVSGGHGMDGLDGKHEGATGEDGNDGEEEVGVYVASIRFDEIREPLVFTIVVLLAAFSKLGFHAADKLSSIVPESCLLIVVGTIFGAIIYFSGIDQNLPEFFTPESFFHYLLPPIILEASFNLYDRAFTETLGSVLIFAVLGTLAACAFVGLSLIGLMYSGAMEKMDVTPVQILVFSALIVAVDPVAVLAVFNEVGVNRILYFLVFGESLLNDGVTVVLYDVLQSYNRLQLHGESITAVHIVLGIIKFIVVCCGGVAIGVLVGVLTAILTKYTNSVRVVEPVTIFGMAYLSYLLAELFHFSGIISIICCGLVQVAYAFNNINHKSKTTVKFFTRVISTTSEIIIFLFLGLLLVRPDHDWKTGFTLWTIILITFYRFGITFVTSFLINKYDKFRVRKIKLEEKFIISYGGLRGAVCFSLVALLKANEFPTKNMFVTTTLAVIIFTVFVQGATIKPFVNLLKVKLAKGSKPETMYEEFHTHVNDHLMAGLELIVGSEGKAAFREKFRRLNDKHFVKWLLKDAPSSVETEELVQAYQKLIMKEHYKNLALCGVEKTSQDAEKYSKVNSSEELTKLRFRKSSKLPMVDEEGGSDDEEVTPRPHDTSPSDLGEMIKRHTLFRNTRYQSFHDENFTGFAKNRRDGNNNKDGDLDKMIRSELRRKRNKNNALQRMTSIRGMPERALSWAEDKCDYSNVSDHHKQPLDKKSRALTLGSTTAGEIRTAAALNAMQSLPEHDESQDDNVPLVEFKPSDKDQNGSSKSVGAVSFEKNEDKNSDKKVGEEEEIETFKKNRAKDLKQMSMDEKHALLHRQGAFSEDRSKNRNSSDDEDDKVDH